MIRVLIVDDSALVRKLLSEALSCHKDITVVGTAVDPYVARDKILQLKPDVVTLDIEMPRMDGLTFLAKLMRYHPLPVIVVSSLTPTNSEAAIRALEQGAVDVIAKPARYGSTEEVHRELVRAVRAAATARPMVLPLPASTRPVRTETAPAGRGLLTTHRIVAIGASTGGTQAIESVLSRLPPDTAGTLIVQHMPEGFTGPFAKRLNGLCAMEVREACDGDSVAPGVALIAPGNKHMLLARSGANYLVRLKDGPPVHHQRPSVDVLFESVARSAGRNAVAALLTGMGADGAQGLLAIRQQGGRTLAQDEDSCVVYGMPKEAAAIGAADEVVPLDLVPQSILSALQSRPKEGGAQPAPDVG